MPKLSDNEKAARLIEKEAGEKGGYDATAQRKGGASLVNRTLASKKKATMKDVKAAAGKKKDNNDTPLGRFIRRKTNAKKINDALKGR